MNPSASAKAMHLFFPAAPVLAQGAWAHAAPEPDFGDSFRTFSAMRQAPHGRIHVHGPRTMGRADFIRHVVLHLPEVSARIAEDDFGILHLEMGAMKLATWDAILRCELQTVCRHFAFIAFLHEHADDALQGAILVSYLEALFLGETAAPCENARSLLPPALAETLRRAELRHTLLRRACAARPGARA